jgi:riboflavin biosynthesis pyrimidine reductase
MIMQETIKTTTDNPNNARARDNLSAMSVFASLVVGADGSTSKNGSSSGISSGADRTTFLARRRNSDFILIGGQTARTEPYHRTPVPVVVASRSMLNALADNRLAHWWNLSPASALEKGIKKFGPNVLVEAGPSLINELIQARVLDGIYLSITSVTDGEDLIKIDELLANFTSIERDEIQGTSFIEAKTLK